MAAVLPDRCEILRLRGALDIELRWATADHELMLAIHGRQHRHTADALTRCCRITAALEDSD